MNSRAMEILADGKPAILDDKSDSNQRGGFEVEKRQGRNSIGERWTRH
jgi:hypothetical protein